MVCLGGDICDGCCHDELMVVVMDVGLGEDVDDVFDSSEVSVLIEESSDTSGEVVELVLLESVLDILTGLLLC